MGIQETTTLSTQRVDFSEAEIDYAVRRQLSWTHLRSLMFVEDELARKFYMEMCRLEKWPTRTLDEKIDSQLYERTAISRRPEEKSSRLNLTR